jgi:hypothetical protein
MDSSVKFRRKIVLINNGKMCAMETEGEVVAEKVPYEACEISLVKVFPFFARRRAEGEREEDEKELRVK